MEWLKKLITELIINVIYLIVGIKVIGDIYYNEKLKESNWSAFISSPFRYIKNNAKPIKL